MAQPLPYPLDKNWPVHLCHQRLSVFNVQVSTRLSTVGDRAFPVAATHLRNCLPSHVTAAPPLPIFCSRLKSRDLFSLSYPAFWLFSHLYSGPAVTRHFEHYNLSHLAPSLPMFPLEFCGEVNHEETIESWAILSSKDPMIVAPACDGRTDGRTDGFTLASTALCIASYADAL